MVCNGIKRRRRNVCGNIATRVDIFYGVVGGNINRLLCNNNGNFHCAFVVVAYLVGSEDCLEGSCACIAYCGSFGCVFNAPCTLNVCRELDDILQQVAIGCSVRGLFELLGVINRSDVVNELLSCTCAICPNVVVAYKGYYCFVRTNVDTAVINNRVALCGSQTGGLVLSVIRLVGYGGNCNSLLCYYKCSCFTFCLLEVVIACKYCLYVVCACIGEICDFILTIGIGEIPEDDLTVCECLVEISRGCLCTVTIRPTLDNGLGDGNVCLLNGYFDRSFGSQIVGGFGNGVGDGVFADADDCINSSVNTLLGDNLGNGCTVGCLNAGNCECNAIVGFCVRIVCAINGNTRLCNGKLSKISGITIEVGVAGCSCLYVVGACISGCGCTDRIVILVKILIGYLGVILERNVISRSICQFTVGPTNNAKVGDNNVCLADCVSKRNGSGFAIAPLIVCTVGKRQACQVSALSYIGIDMICNIVESRCGNIYGDRGSVVDVILGIFGGIHGLLFDGKRTGLNQIEVVLINNRKSCNIRTCVGGTRGCICGISCRCELVFNRNVTKHCACRAVIACLTVYPRIDCGLSGPCVGGRSDTVFRIKGGLYVRVVPFIACCIKNNLCLIGTNGCAADIFNSISFPGNQAGVEKCTGVNLRLICAGDLRNVNLFLCNVYGNLYLGTFVVFGCRCKDCYKLVLTNTANLGVFIRVGACIKQNGPISFTVLGELDRIEQKVAKCRGAYGGLAGICLGNCYSSRNNGFLIVGGLGKRKRNNVFTCVENRVNLLTVQLVFNSKFTYRVICGNAFQYKRIFVVGEVVMILYALNLSGCLLNLKRKLTGYGIIVGLIRIVGSKYCRIGLASGRKCDVAGGLIPFNHPRILTHSACGKCNLSQRQVGIPNRSKINLTEYGVGVNLFDGKLFGYVACLITLVFEFKSDAILTCVGVSGVFKHGKACVLFAVGILNNIRKRMLLTVVVELFFANNLNNQLFFLYFYLNCALDDVILVGIIGSKYGNVLLDTYVTNQGIGVFPRPCTVAVLVILEEHVCKNILINSKLFFKYRVCNVKNSRLNSQCALLNIENNIRVRCRCGQRIHTGSGDDILGLSNRETDQLSNHLCIRVTNAQQLIFNGGVRIARNYFVAVDFNRDGCMFDFVCAD